MSGKFPLYGAVRNVSDFQGIEITGKVRIDPVPLVSEFFTQMDSRQTLARVHYCLGWVDYPVNAKYIKYLFVIINISSKKLQAGTDLAYAKEHGTYGESAIERELDPRVEEAPSEKSDQVFMRGLVGDCGDAM